MNDHIPKLVPLLTIGGFLGSGKTTLVNRILKEKHGKRIVVFVNDFADISIDADLIETADANKISLKNGCVCCSLNDDLIEGITNIVKDPFETDAILIEASGVADSNSLASSLEVLEASEFIHLDARIYILDPDIFVSLDFEISESLIDQAAQSDIILLNKVDSSGADNVEKLWSILAESAPYSAIVETAFCNVSLDLLFGPKTRIATKSTHEGSASDNHRFASHVFQSSVPVDRSQFDQFVKTLPESCIRAKGVVRFLDTPNISHVFQMVGHRASVSCKPQHSDTDKTQFVAIGFADQFDGKFLESEFQKLTRSLPDTQTPEDVRATGSRCSG